MPICTLISESKKTQTLFIRAAWPLKPEQVELFRDELGSYIAERDCRPLKFILALDCPIVPYNLSVLLGGQDKVSKLGGELNLFTDNPATGTTLVNSGFFENFLIYSTLRHVLEAHPNLPSESIIQTYARMRHMLP